MDCIDSAVVRTGLRGGSDGWLVMGAGEGGWEGEGQLWVWIHFYGGGTADV